MVNINGQRVEPGEISGVMMGLPGIIQAAVKDFEGADGQTFLCAYYAAAAEISNIKGLEGRPEDEPPWMPRFQASFFPALGLALWSYTDLM